MSTCSQKWHFHLSLLPQMTHQMSDSVCWAIIQWSESKQRPRVSRELGVRSMTDGWRVEAGEAASGQNTPIKRHANKRREGDEIWGWRMWGVWMEDVGVGEFWGGKRDGSGERGV